MGTSSFTEKRAAGSDNGVGREHYAKIPRAVVLHRMKVAECLADRLFWAGILWSWCGPHHCDDIVKKDDKGYFCHEGNSSDTIYAAQKDLRELLGLPESMKTHVSEAIQSLIADGSFGIREEERFGYHNFSVVMYPVREPTWAAKPVDSSQYWEPSNDSKGLTGAFHIADLIIPGTMLPADPIAREAVSLKLSDLSTGWKNDLKALRTRYRKAARLAISGGVYKEEEKKRILEEEEGLSSSSSSEYVEPEEATTTPPLERGPEELFHQNLSTKFTAAGKPAPVRRQSMEAMRKLQSNAAGFLEWIDTERMKRAKHPGILSDWITEYLQTKEKTGQAESPPKMTQEELCKEQEAILRDPKATEQAKETARTILETLGAKIVVGEA